MKSTNDITHKLIKHKKNLNNLIVSFDIIDNNICNIKTFDNYSDLLIWLGDIRDDQVEKYSDEEDEYIRSGKWFYDQRCNIGEILSKKTNKIYYRISWILNDNEYLKYEEEIIESIDAFKKTKWYIKYMRANKLNRIIE